MRIGPRSGRLSPRRCASENERNMAAPLRQSPVSTVLSGSTTDPTRPDVQTGVPNPEPLLRVQNIQGNILGGFSKDHQMNVYFAITDPHKFKAWLKSQIPFVATSSEVIAFNRLFKSTRSRRGREGTVKATWFNIAFTFKGMKELNPHANQFQDVAFKAGLPAHSASLNDPTGNHFGSPTQWVIGGTHNHPDGVLIIAEDDRADMLAEVERLEETILAFRDGNNVLHESGAKILYKDEAANLPAPIGGHEHFGFLDGVSQPGIRGVVSEDPTDVYTLRQNPDEPTDQGLPGQDVLWPGEFVFGYPRQDPTKDIAEPGPDSLLVDRKNPAVHAGPTWARDGSFLVIRRLHQDVFGFHTFLRDTAAANSVVAPPHSSGAAFVGSRLVGRWPSGAPVLRAPNDDDFALGNNDCDNNRFEFGGPAPDPPAPGTGDQCKPGPFPQSPGDVPGNRCPFTAHIRKAYPRDDESSSIVDGAGNSLVNESTTQTHRLLRRGIPYGPVSPRP